MLVHLSYTYNYNGKEKRSPKKARKCQWLNIQAAFIGLCIECLWRSCRGHTLLSHHHSFITFPHSATQHCFFEVSIAGAAPQRIEIELFDNTPITSKNFLALCTGEVSKQGKQLTYKGTTFHRYVWPTERLHSLPCCLHLSIEVWMNAHLVSFPSFFSYLSQNRTRSCHSRWWCDWK